MYKSECTRRSELQFRTFSTSFDSEWFLYFLICDMLKQPCIEKNLLLPTTTVCRHILVNDLRGREVGEKMTRCAIEGIGVKKMLFYEWRTFWITRNKFLDRLMLPIYICVLKVRNAVKSYSRHIHLKLKHCWWWMWLV